METRDGNSAKAIREAGVSVTKSVESVDADTRLVTLSMHSTADEPVMVSLIESVPETHALASLAGDGPTTGGPTAYSDGSLVVEQVTRPGERVALGYLVRGAPETDLPIPSVERVVPVTDDAQLLTETAAEWVGADGAATLDVAPSVVPGVTDEDLPLIALPDAESPADESAMADAAVGVVLTAANEDAAYRTALRAGRRGHTVIATYAGLDADAESLDTLADLGAIVLSPPRQRASQSELHRLLSQHARERGLPGIVLQTRDCPRIDYDRTALAFERADYDVIAIPEQWRETDDGPAVVVAIPAYNAAGSIGDVVERADAFADEVVVIDDGSRDETGTRAREAGATVVVHDRNRGYGGALKTAFREAAARDAAHLVVIDADGQHDPADIPLLVETQTRDDADVVIGSRYVGESHTQIPLVRSLGLALINNLTNVSLGNLRPSGWVRDTQSGYRAYSRRAVRSLAADPTIGDNMGASTDILYHAHRNRLSVAEVGTTISYDVENSSTQGSLSHGLDLVRNIMWTVEYGRPLLIVGVPGAITTLLGVSVTLLLVAQFVETGTLYPIQLGTAVLFGIGGLLLCITALMMHVLNGHPSLRRLER
ncbi:glycosyltransferase family 2 protein [Halomicroarcula limicola]|uniref:Glycosyltransferase family 2 protein n=1 Tax=Haloarcula limicola TaxID=1429915 RepID=A0A8J7Y3Z5_9EURY|nr:glycosyltransferase family 2 protein [Halomicroarcula limicola]MBV0923975.1 glycosyltransferase family 2 protein [Halomicroarcula limicola]